MLIDDIKKRMLQALKSGNTVEKEVLRVALGEMQTQAARSQEPFSDEEGFAIIRKLVKSNRETLEAATDAAQQSELRRELEVLEGLLPKGLSVGEIVAALAAVADAVKAAGNDGQATGVAMKHLKASGANVSGKDVSEAVRQLRAG